jgi:hypothetical protein
MKMNKKLIAVSGIASLILIASCKKDFLDVPPQGQQAAEQFWTS